MRIATAHAYDLAVTQLQRRQSDMSDAQAKLTSGKRVERGSDDPSNAARGERASSTIARLDATQRALEASRTSMELGEGALGAASEDLQRARELLVQAGNGSLTDNERNLIATELRSLRDSLLGTANRTDGAGRYLFGGQGSDGPPFVDTPAGVVFQGTPGIATVAGSGDLPISVDGDYAWMRPAGGTTVFAALDQVITDLQTPGRIPTDISAGTVTAISAIDASMDRLGAVRAQVGSTLNRLDVIEGRISDSRIANETERSVATDLDFTKAITDFQTKQAGYDAALRSYAMVQRMSLFQYIGS
jgi:flagellar hook-associated protein 3 FlgL